ncbi:MAG: argininosuccinate lyase, partial [Actinobacteria bacterium]
LALGALTAMAAAARFDTDRMAAAADAPDLGATDLAEFLVAKGMAFREAHSLVGSLVRQADDGGTPLVDLVRGEAQLGPDAAALLEPGVAVTRRTTPGGGGPEAVARQLERFRARLESDRTRLRLPVHPAT